MPRNFSAPTAATLFLAAVTGSLGATTRPADDAGRVANPLYPLCVKYKPGSTATFAVASTSAKGKQTVTLTVTLRAVAADAVRLAVTSTVLGQPGGPKSSELSVPATLSVDRAWPAAPGVEDVAVGGRVYHCRVYSAEGPMPFAANSSTQPTPMAQNRYWVSDDAPGGLLKMTSDREVDDAIGKTHIEMTMTGCVAK